ncbi:hypothetical protein QSE00_23930 [Arenibacter sp. M-2]|uniref:hypothetical protein n=1 Tax=Arenibacter sp. M-2 TaxID=3053612 RepID=UPI0025701461|nr:hypothetical protein [Arenibacter sp. M-2]MDL5514881.1 hypothetical protein [Arenibacter sp. M-2]
MKKSTFKSIVAILAGFVLGATLSLATDFLFDKLGIMSMDNFKETSAIIILVVIVYRFAFNVIGCYLAAKLAPSNPMKHVIIMGTIGTVLSILGSLTMWDLVIAWYNISIILIALPSAILGGKLYLINQK